MPAVVALFALAPGESRAGEVPVVGIVEQIPVLANGVNVSARPVYIFTDRKLSGPAVFSGLQGPGSTLDVVCCYEVKDTVPTSLDAALAAYGKDPDFADHMKSVRGYRYVYAAQPVADRRRWTPLMKTLARIAADPADGSPFSAAVVGAQFDRPTLPASFTANGVPMTLRTRFDATSGRIIHTFTRGADRIEFSESAFAD